MATFLIISLIVAVILISLAIYGGFSFTKNKPIESISWGECLNIHIGDKEEKVIQRLKVLNLYNDDQQNSIQREIMSSWGCPLYINTKEYQFNNIKDMSFNIENGVCTKIFITLYPQQADLEFIKNKVERMITQKLGSPIANNGKEVSWLNKRTGDMIYLSSDGILLQKLDC